MLSKTGARKRDAYVTRIRRALSQHLSQQLSPRVKCHTFDCVRLNFFFLLLLMWNFLFVCLFFVFHPPVFPQRKVGSITKGEGRGIGLCCAGLFSKNWDLFWPRSALCAYYSQIRRGMRLLFRFFIKATIKERLTVYCSSVMVRKRPSVGPLKCAAT